MSFSSEHVALYLHRGGFFDEQLPELAAKLTKEIQLQPGDWGESS